MVTYIISHFEGICTLTVQKMIVTIYGAQMGIFNLPVTQCLGLTSKQYYTAYKVQSTCPGIHMFCRSHFICDTRHLTILWNNVWIATLIFCIKFIKTLWLKYLYVNAVHFLTCYNMFNNETINTPNFHFHSNSHAVLHCFKSHAIFHCFPLNILCFFWHYLKYLYLENKFHI